MSTTRIPQGLANHFKIDSYNVSDLLTIRSSVVDYDIELRNIMGDHLFIRHNIREAQLDIPVTHLHGVFFLMLRAGNAHEVHRVFIR